MKRFDRSLIPAPIELLSPECGAHRDSILATPGTDVDDDLYRGKQVHADGSVTYNVQVTLRNLYQNKCAYCEKLAFQPKVDHHRPKGKISNMPRGTNGYYWLCYEWTNLLPCCTDCNSVGAKGARYPVQGNRNTVYPVAGTPPTADLGQFIYDHAYNTQEKPLLLHPEYCYPEKEFDFDITGKIVGITDAGIETVRVIKLDNADLNGWRRQVYYQKLDRLRELLLSYLTESPNVLDFIESQINKWLLALVKESENDSLEYTLFRKILVKKFDYYFIDPLEPELQPIIKGVFLKYIQSIV